MNDRIAPHRLKGGEGKSALARDVTNKIPATGWTFYEAVVSRLCTYHPDAPAQWECRYCGIGWCSQCIATNTIQTYGISGTHQAQSYCPSCNRPVKKIVPRRTDQSFWKVLPQLLGFPFHYQPLLFIFPISILTVILSSLGFSFFFLIFLWGGMLPLAFAALQETAQGKLSSPKVTGKMLHDKLWGTVKHFTICFVLFFSFVLLAETAGLAVGLLYLGVIVMVVPAVITVLFFTESLVRAAHPRLLILTAQKLGRGYLSLALLLDCFIIVSLGSGAFIRSFLSPDFEHLFLSMAVSYFTVVAYQLIGCVIYQGTKALATIPDFRDYFEIEEERATDSPQQGVLHIVDRLIAEDRIQDAITYIQDKTAGAIDDLELAQRYYDLLKLRHDVKKLLDHAKQYLDLLVSSNREKDLCTVYLDCRKEDPDFSPSPSTFFKIGRLLNKEGNSQDAVDAFIQFITVYHRNTLTPKAYFLAAMILHEQLKESDQAIRILKAMINGYPDHHMTRQAREYLKTVMRKLRRETTRFDTPVHELHALKTM